MTPSLILKPKYDTNHLTMKHKKFDCGRLFKKRRLEMTCVENDNVMENKELKMDSKEEKTEKHIDVETGTKNSDIVKSISENKNVQNDDSDSDDCAIDGQIRTCYECKICKEMFLSTLKMKQHLNKMHNLILKHRDTSKFYKIYPFKNVRPINGLRAYACSVCLMMYYNVQSLKKHQIITHGALLGLSDVEIKKKSTNNNIHVCSVCHKNFLDPQNLRYF